MIETVLDGAGLHHWLFAVILAFTAIAGTLGAAGAVWAWRRRWPLTALAPFIVLAVAGAVGFVAAIEVTRTGSRFFFVELREQREQLRDLRLMLTYVLAGGLAALGAAAVFGTVLAVASRRQLSGATSAIAGSVVAVVLVLAGTGVLVSWLDDVTRVVQQGQHPFDVVSGEPATAELIRGGINFPIGIAAAPTGELFYAEHFSGRIGMLTLEADRYTDGTFAMVPKPPNARLFHIAVHPDWPEQPYLYATVQRDGAGERPQQLDVVRLEARDGLAVAIDTVIEGLPTENPDRGGGHDHYGAAIAACGDYLYVSVGDTDSPEVAPNVYQPGRVRFGVQSFNTAIGKVLRYRLERAEVVPDGVVGDPPVFALGFRNPFDMACDPASDLPFVFDNGNRGFDQVRFATPGSNHGWPLSDQRRDMTPAVYSTQLTPIGATGLAARSTGDATELFFTGFNTAAVYRLLVDPSTHDLLDTPRLLYNRDDALLAMTTDTSGCIWVASPSAIWRLRESGCSEPSVLAASTGSLAEAGSAAVFYASACAPCHGLDREGGVGPSLRPSQLTQSDDFYAETILGGRPGTAMPAWGEAGLTESEARELVDYLRSAFE